jgi:signal transduction histidine kinase/ligand-binding sensor domain-containing protein
LVIFLYLTMRKPGLLFALILLWATGWAQQYPFVYYTPKDGLVNSRVSKIYQDSKGRLYFMTFGGLSVYDGARFRNFTSQNGLAADMVNDVVEAGEDSFLVATNINKLNMLVHGVIKTFPSPNQSSPIINHFLKSKDGNIYATADEGLFIIKENLFTALPLNIAPASQPAFFGNILEFNNYLLLNTNDLRHFRGLYLYDKLKKKIIDSLPQIIVAGFEKDRKGQIWITIQDSVKTVDTAFLSRGKLRILPLPPSYQAAAKYPTGSFAFEENHAWTIYDGRELVRTGTDGSQVKLIPNKDGRSGIERVFIDRENIVWICSNDYGVFKLVNTTLQFNNLLQVNDQKGIIFFTSYGNDTAWFRDNNKLIRQTGGKTESFLTDIPSQFYWAMQSGPHLYVACLQKIYFANVPGTTGARLHFQLLHTLSGYNAWRGLGIQDPYGRVIVAEKDSIMVFNNKNVVGQFETYPDDFIENLSIDRSNRLWVTTRGGGITIFTINPDDPVNYLKPVYHFQKEMKGASARCMTFDKNGNAWVGTRSNGLMAFSFENNQLKLLLHLQRRQGLTDDFIVSLACDSTNAILAGSQTGLDRITLNNKNEFRIENITKRNNTFGYIASIWVDKKGEASAMLQNGALFKIAPIKNTDTAFKPKLFIEEVKVNGTTVQPGTGMELPYTQRNLTINMAAPSYVDEQQVQYSYQLQGSGNNEWSDPSPNPDFNFLNLSPGKYTLNVKASFPSTDYAPSFLAYSFSIIPPYWQTNWFRVMAGIFLIGVAFVISRFYYNRKLEKQMMLLEKQQAVEKERTRIATDMHDDLGAGLSKIKFLSETIGIKKQQQQPIEEDISKIREYSHDMIDKMGEIVWALNQKNDSLSDLLSYTRAYASEYLSQNGIHCSFHEPEQYPPESVSGEFRRNIYLTVKEALHNVVKHAQASEVCITIITDHDLQINIHDNGTGFNENNIRPFSNGLGNMKKRMEGLGGSCTILHDNGTIVLIAVPL